MSGRSGRFVFFLALVAVSSPLCFKGHDKSRKGNAVAFLPFTSQGITVRITGNTDRKGVYTFREGADIASVIILTSGGTVGPVRCGNSPDARLKNGDVVSIGSGTSEHLDISTKSMKARDRILLGIPLDPDRMDEDDWRCLPGIGPVLARRLHGDRQINGDYRSVESLKRVPGIGEAKLDGLKKYF